MKVTIDKAAQLIVEYVKADIPVNLLGSPGIGKSDIIRTVADKLKLKVIDFRLSTCDPTDLSGIPFISDNRSRYMPNEAFPLATDEVPDGYEGWLLFLDEITNAPMAVQAAAYQLVLDRQVGQNPIHEKVRIVSAGNLIDDGAAVTGEMSTALKSRMAHINIQVSVDAWLDWALTNGVAHEITSYIKFKPDDLHRFDPNTDADTFPCPRTWGMVNSIVKTTGMNSKMLKDLVSGAISDGVATNFMNFCKNFTNLPTYADIVKDPENIDVPKEMSTLFALSGSIGAQTKIESVSQVMKFIARMPAEFQLRTFTDFTRRDPMLVTNADVRAWLSKNAKHLMSD